MIDYLKLNVSYLSQSELLNNHLIKWNENYSAETGELKYPVTGKYYNMETRINPTRNEIEGSIHKLRNVVKKSQNQNYDDFTFDDLIEMIKKIENDLGLDLNNTIIENLEIGLNIHTSKSPEEILNNNLIVWDCMTPSKNNTYKGKGKYLVFERSHDEFKIYDKGKQYERPENILRIECKIKTSELLQKKGNFKTLSNISNIPNLNRLLDFLYESFDKCIMVDTFNPETVIEPKDRETFTKGINPFTWQSLQGMSKKRFKEKFSRILELYKLDTLKKEIDSKLKAKGKELLKSHDLKECYKMNDITDVQSVTECYKMNDFVEVTETPKNGEMLQNEPYIYFHSITQRKCMVTGIDISHQKDDSKFLSKASIKKIFETDPENFKKLSQKFSPRHPEKMTFEKLCLEIAHNIRNRDSNKRHEIKRKKVFYKNSLFPL